MPDTGRAQGGGPPRLDDEAAARRRRAIARNLLAIAVDVQGLGEETWGVLLDYLDDRQGVLFVDQDQQAARTLRALRAQGLEPAEACEWLVQEWARDHEGGR